MTTEPTPEPDADGVIHVDSAQAEPADVEVPDTDDVEVPDTIEAARKLRSENRSLRQRLHTAEADVEKLVTQQAAWQRAEIERTAAEVLVDPADVWRIDPDTQQSFYDQEFGEISVDGVVSAAKKLASEKPHLAKPNTAPPPSKQPIEGLRGGASPEPKKTETTWSSALRGTGL